MTAPQWLRTYDPHQREWQWHPGLGRIQSERVPFRCTAIIPLGRGIPMPRRAIPNDKHTGMVGTRHHP